jgi:SAM-dependent methyltransferase
LTTVTTERAQRIQAVGYDYAAREVEPVPVCNLCGGRNLSVATTRDRYGYPATSVRCDDCGLLFLSPRLTAAEYGAFYESVYRPLVSAFHGRLIDAHTVQDDQRGYADDLVEFLRASLPAPPTSVLDIGGSTGLVAGAVCRAFDAHAVVLDPAPDELEVAAQAGHETVTGFAEDYDPGERRFDLVLLCQTIDHLLDVAGTLAAIRRVLAPTGFAFIDVLDVELAAERAGSLEGAVKIDHPFYLDDRTARAFFATADLDVRAARLSADGHRGYILAPGGAA